MLVSHRYKFIYTKTVKTAGTSVESYFERFCMPGGEWSLSLDRDEYVSDSGIIGFRTTTPSRPCSSAWWNHMPAAGIREKVGEEIWAAYFKFCVIRNPYDKAVSAFYFYRSFNRPESNGSVGLSDLDNLCAEFEAWLQSPELPIDRDKYLIDGQFCLDDVIRYERLANDLERICGRLGISWDPASLPTFRSGFRAGNTNIESLYTEKSKEIVESAYSFEIDYFGYSFPASASRST